ncbi:universal stress protein [Luteithermobacter gelatinilyticus]|uniref:universal stress protein n=1 Tax=Luteithermobacter gelatinilyticus TaxID=2582913 RepID=UPI001105B180|nr:universal stress protein [Luteithermobacter gelatinilyticus]|tara:strand:- start:9840 stop:10331 length:492 start_codon:yes stop_codon:yes gene_type:complete
MSTTDKTDKTDSKWKFLVIADNTPEFRKVLRLASLRAAKVGGSMVMLHIIQPQDFQHWVSVKELMEEEARQEAEEMLQEFVREAEALSGMTPEIVIRTGDFREVIVDYIREDQDVHLLVLGANVDGDPGPIVRAFREELLKVLHMPVLVVPGNMTDEEIDKFV